MIAIVWKDLLLELRTREMVTSLLLLGILVLLILSFAFDPTTEVGRAAAPGALWVSVLFAGILGIHRSVLREAENSCLEGLLLAPVDRGTIFFAKALGNFLIISAAQVLVVPAFIVFFNLPFAKTFLDLGPILLLGVGGFSAIATLFAAVALRTRAREVMLPLLLLPLATPLFLACVQASRILLEGTDVSEAANWFRMLIAFDVVFLVIGWMAFESVIGD